MLKIAIPVIGALVIGAALSCGGIGGDPVKDLANCNWKWQGDYLKNAEGFRSVSDYRDFLQHELDTGSMDMDDIQRHLEICRENS